MATTDFDARHYWDKRLKRNWSLHGVGMVRLAHSYNRWMYRVRRRVFRRTIRRARIDAARSSVLDIGSGTGFYIGMWKELGAARIQGVDIADSAVERLSEKFPDVPFERMDISDDPPFEEGGYDAVSAFDVLFHIVDDDRYERALANVHRLLGPDGRFVFSENFVPKKKARRKHYVSRSREEIEDLLRASGFEVVYRQPMFAFMAPPVASVQQWRWNLWSKRMLPLIKRERLGGAVGAAMYPFEVFLTRVLKQSPVMEIVVCRKRPASE